MRLSIISGKGGVGKTFLSVNLSVVFAEVGYSVLLVDANFTSPTIATYFKTLPETHTIDSAITKGAFSPDELVWVHPDGFHFVTPSFNLAALDDEALHKIFEMLSPLFQNYDIVVLDGPAGAGRDLYYTLMNSDSALVVANPNTPSLYNALKVSYFAKALGKMIPGAVLNMYGRGDVSPKEASEILELPLIGIIPEDKSVVKSVSAGRPLVRFAPSSPAAKAVYEVAETLLGKRITRRKKQDVLAEIIERVKRFLFS